MTPAQEQEQGGGMTWTTAKPTAAGHYWFREGPDDHDPWIVRVVEWETHIIAGGEWAGPIPLPKEGQP